MNLKIYLSLYNKDYIGTFLICSICVALFSITFKLSYVIISISISFFLICLFLDSYDLSKIDSNKIILNKKQLSIRPGWSYKKNVYLWKNIEAISTIKKKLDDSTTYVIEIVLKERLANGLNSIQIQIGEAKEHSFITPFITPLKLDDIAHTLTDLLNHCCNEYKYEDIYTEDIDQIGLNQFLENLRTTHYIKYKWYN